MSDSAQRAAAKIAAFVSNQLDIHSSYTARKDAAYRFDTQESIAAIIRGECFPEEPYDETLAEAHARDLAATMQARAEHLEAVLAKVREECEHGHVYGFRTRLLKILNESGEAAGGSE